ncbi:MAG TPA: nucleoside-diphosphate kinase, partial [Actinomycetota bacterium]|nr:nucleoside-diphosphate kinase [Actinomycetota bacterium]
MAEESTLLIVKPDAVRRRLIGEIVSRIERKNLRVEAMRMMRVDRDLAERHYQEHAEKPFFGEHMARNAAAAVAACESLLGRDLDEGSVREALSEVKTPARLEVVRRRPLVVLDGAHNPDAGNALVHTLTEEFTWSRLHLVIAMFRDKDVESFVQLVA